MDLNHVSAFVGVVEARSFTGAARALSLPKSSVSRSVAHLEKELGVTLLQRTTRKLHLTDAGRLYYDKARAALAELDDAGASVSKLGSELRGIVRVTAPPDMAVLVLPAIVAEYVRKNPGVKVDMSLSSRRVDLVEEGVDIAVRAGVLGDSSLVARKVGSTELGLFAATSYLKKKGRPRALADLAAHDCVLFRAPKGSARWTLTGPSGEESVEVHGRVNTDDLGFVHGAVSAGLGVGLLPTFRCTGSGAWKTERLLPELAVRGTPVHVVTTSVRQETAAVASFREHLILRMLESPWTERHAK